MDPEPPGRAPRPTPPWLFFFLLIPYGMTSAHALVALPYLLSRAGVPVAQVASLVALTLLPNSWKFLWTPLIDTWLTRRRWLLIGNLVAAAGTTCAFCLPLSQDLTELTALLLVVSVAAATAHNALGSLCATTVALDKKGAASGAFSAGQMAWSGAGGSLILLLHEPPAFLRVPFFGHGPRPWSLPAIGMLVGAFMALSTLLVLFVDDAPGDSPGEGTSLAQQLRHILRDTLGTLRTGRGRCGLLICLSPLGTAAASNLTGALAPDFGAAAAGVTLAAGLPSGASSCAGSLLGGWLADRAGADRQRAYLLSGLCVALAAALMALVPPTPSTYVVCSLLYDFTGGMAYATFYALAFELIGPTVGATTTYGVLAGAANLAVSYTTYLDGLGYRRLGHRGLLGCDALLGLVGVIAAALLLAARERSLSTRRSGR